MIKILVVEDDEKLNFAVCKHLSYHSYSAKGVYDGNAALKALDAEKFDLIISDIMMPNMDGIQFNAPIKVCPDDESRRGFSLCSKTIKLSYKVPFRANLVKYEFEVEIYL